MGDDDRREGSPLTRSDCTRAGRTRRCNGDCPCPAPWPLPVELLRARPISGSGYAARAPGSARVGGDGWLGGIGLLLLSPAGDPRPVSECHEPCADVSGGGVLCMLPLDAVGPATKAPPRAATRRSCSTKRRRRSLGTVRIEPVKLRREDDMLGTAQPLARCAALAQFARAADGNCQRG